MNNSEIADVFQDIAGLLEMKGEKRFTVVAYQRAARALGHYPSDIGQAVRDGADLTEIPGVGKAISAKTAELVTTGRMAYFDRLRAEFPDSILDVMRVPGIGPKTARLISDELGVSTVADLEKAIEAGHLAELPRMGQKKADNVLREIRAARTKDDRVPIARAMPAAERLIAALRERCPSITALQAAGSLRRFEETIGDIDLVCAAGDPRHVLDTLVEQPNVSTVLVHGDTKAAVVLSEGVQVDLRVVEAASFGALLAYSTGNRQHNILLREHALRLGLSLNEYGLTDVVSGELEPFADEEALYERLGLQYIAPELRQGMDEIKLAAAMELPRLVEVGDLRGDLHVHTDWSDGRDPVELMVVGARDRGYEYVAITDHSSGRGIANGLTEERLVEQARELRRVEESVRGIRVLKGTEVDIRADGTVDYADEVLAELDWVVASVHSGRGQSSAVMTDRIIRAMHNPHVTAIGHLSTRMIGQREPIDADYEALFRAAAETGTVLEINASPERLDLKDTHARRASDLGAFLAIASDAHTVDTLANQRYGIGIARRARCEARHVVNTLPLAEFVSFLGLQKSKRSRFMAERG